MPRWLNVLVQILSAAGGILGAVQGTKWAPFAALGVNSAVGIISQQFNTDGTPQTTAFVPKSKQVIPPPQVNQ